MSLAGRVSEKVFMRQVLDAARLLGWSCYHTFDSRRSAPGFPDLFCVREGGPLLAVECKTEKGRLSEWQRRWLDLLRSAGIDTRVWRPSDWDEIETTLRGEDER